MAVFGTKDDIYELMDKFGESSLSELDISTGSGENEIKIKMMKTARGVNLDSGRNIDETAEDETEEDFGDFDDDIKEMNIKLSKSEKSAANKSFASAGNVIKSPLVGTFYSSPSPDSEPYVKIGDKISKGMAVCVIEAMKTMNEIESDTDGEIAEILLNDGSPVEYGQILFRLR